MKGNRNRAAASTRWAALVKASSFPIFSNWLTTQVVNLSSIRGGGSILTVFLWPNLGFVAHLATPFWNLNLSLVAHKAINWLGLETFSGFASFFLFSRFSFFPAQPAPRARGNWPMRIQSSLRTPPLYTSPSRNQWPIKSWQRFENYVRNHQPSHRKLGVMSSWVQRPGWWGWGGWWRWGRLGPVLLLGPPRTIATTP